MNVSTGCKTIPITFPDGFVVNVEVVSTLPEMVRGLAYRQDLRPDEGMLFVYPRPGFHPFTMADTLLSLDMLWMDWRGRIVEMQANIQPGTISSGGNRISKYGLEVPAGTIARCGLKLDQTVDLGAIYG